MVVGIMSDSIYIYPTDTVWGIGGSIRSRSVQKTISKIKKTDVKKPISILFSSIDQIHNFINIKSIFSNDWLERFFTFETTLGIPKSWWKDESSKWIFGESEYVAIRFLKLPHVLEICNKETSPIFTTSLNVSGEEVISQDSSARAFFNKYVLPCEEDAIFVSNENKLSGDSSTIVFYDEHSFRIIRSGKLINQVRQHLELLSTTIL